MLAHIPRHYWPLGADEFFGDADALTATEDYLTKWKNWRDHGVGLQFYSPTQGTGKTMLACIIGKELIKRRTKVRFVTFLDLISELKEDRSSEHLRDVPVLILDEVTSGFTAAQNQYFAFELESLIRYRSDGNGVTIITTNMTPEKLDEQYPRTFSLLSSKQKYVHVHGVDARKSYDWDQERMYLIEHGEARPIT